MPIWFDGFPMDYAVERARDSMIGHLGIEVIEAGDDYLKARMPVDHRTKQPAGVLHGGASVTLAETLASWGAAFCVDRTKHHCVGLEVNANHLRPVSGGFVTAVARPVHLGRTTHVWEIRISDERDRLVCIARITMAVLASAMQY
jgi:1,4-dihydroxy-2-naphthoyl-CoA hydrolase